MKPLAIWLAIVVIVFGGYALITTALRETKQVLVVVDSSFQMRPVWSDAQLELDRIDDQDHAEFALATEKGPVHSWRADFRLPAGDPFAPCGFEDVIAFPDVAEADELILITTTDNTCDLAEFTDWNIIELTP
ncbi:MAG: hypothetical protein WBP59_12175 [Ilumatobacteraceae bacterium]